MFAGFKLVATGIILLVFVWVQLDFEERRYGGRIFNVKTVEGAVIATVRKEGFERKGYDANAFFELELQGSDAYYAKNRIWFFLFLAVLAMGVIRSLKLSKEK